MSNLGSCRIQFDSFLYFQVGPSGGGKSTITKLLLRLYDVQEGFIAINNIDITQIKKKI